MRICGNITMYKYTKLYYNVLKKMPLQKKVKGSVLDEVKI